MDYSTNARMNFHTKQNVQRKQRRKYFYTSMSATSRLRGAAAIVTTLKKVVYNFSDLQDSNWKALQLEKLCHENEKQGSPNAKSLLFSSPSRQITETRQGKHCVYAVPWTRIKQTWKHKSNDRAQVGYWCFCQAHTHDAMSERSPETLSRTLHSAHKVVS